MAVNQVIVNGEELVNLRNDTVTPETLVEGETATNREGEHIQGELDPVSHDEAYLVDDPIGAIDDDDYIPFNDVSDEDEPKKKTLFSAIVNKLKDTFVSKIWGHVTFNQTGEYLELKDNEVDATQSDNGITANHYPSSDRMIDKNGLRFAVYEGIARQDGSVSAKMYAENYDTNGNSVGQNAISANVDKQGNMSYNVSDHNKFRNAIKTVDQQGTSIPNNTDLNTYKTAGTYRVVDDASAATITNLPLALCGKVIVFDNGNGGYEQFYLPNHSPRIFFRVWWNNAWTAWKELGEGGGDIKPHTYEIGTEIPANSDLNDYKTAGSYFIKLDADASTISNVPVASAGKVIVVETTNANTYVTQFFIDNASYNVYLRYYHPTSGWFDWQKIATNLIDHTHLLDGNIFETSHAILYTDDLDNFTNTGTYQYTYNANGMPINAPNLGFIVSFKLIVDKYANDSRSEVMQTMTMINSDKQGTWWRVRTWNASTWGAWKHVANVDDINPSIVGDGYAVATVSGSAITATISGFKLRAGVIVTIRLNTELYSDCTLNISDTGAKYIRYFGDVAISYGGALKLGTYTFMYDGTYYRVISVDKSPTIQIQEYVADTSGNILLDWGYQSNRAQLKYNLSNNRLVWNYYKNSAWRGDVAIADNNDLNTIYNVLGAKNLFPWDLTLDIFRNLTYSTHTITNTNGVIEVNVTTTSENANKGVYINNQTINGMLQDFNGQQLILSCDMKCDGSAHTISFGLDSSYTDYNIGTSYTHVERTITLDTSLTNNHWHFYNKLTQTITYHIKNLMVRPATILNQTYEPYSLTNQQVLNGLNASVAKTGKSILPLWDYTTNTWSTNGLTFTFNPTTGQITVNGTATADVDCRLLEPTKYQFRLPKGEYILSGCPSGGSDSKYSIRLAVYDGTNVLGFNDYGNGCKVTLSKDCYSSVSANTGFFLIRVKSGQTLSNLVFKPMLRPAYTTAEHEPCEDIHKGNCYVGTCTTAGGTKDKVAYVDGYFVLRKGVRVAIKFSNTNTYSSTTSSPVTLNVNDTGAKNIWYNSTHSGAGNTGTGSYIYGEAGKYFYFVYDGTYWIWDGRTTDSNSTNFLRNDASSTMTASSPTLALKASNIDASKADNDVTSTQYPAYLIQDKSGRTLSRLETIVEANGNIGSYWYIRNFNTSGESVSTKGIKMTMAKDGGVIWAINEGARLKNDLGIGYCACSTAEATLAKTASLTNYQLVHGSIVIVHFANNVPANSTLNINGQGAKAIYYRGNAIQANMILGGDRAIFAYDNYYHLIGIDRTNYVFKNYSYNNSAGTPTEVTIDDTNIKLPQLHYYVKGDMVMVSFIIKFVSAKNYGASNVKLFHGLYAPKQHVFCESQGKSFYLDTSGNFYIRGLSQSVTAGQTLWGITLTYIR